MRKKRNIVAITLCLALFAAMAMGSGASNSGNTKDIVPADGTEAGDSEAGDSNSNEASQSAKSEVTIGEQVLVDQDGIKVTATEYVHDSIWGDGIKLVIENNSDKDMTIGCDALIVNDFMISDLFVSTVAVGKKANETMNLSSAQLKAAGIDTVGKIEMYFHAYDENTYDTVFSKVYSEIQTSEYANMDTTADDAGTELYNAGGIRIVGKTVDEDSFWGTAILLYTENTSGANVGVQVDDMSINGFMMSPCFSTTIYDGKKSFDDITVFSSDLEENGITSIEEVELKFHIYNIDTYDTISDTDPIKFSAK